ncbi:MAG: NHL repeat-containing protein [Lachnospiraceae bacterium]|nr:NHL repeat-containing protein [Lachnospiraceae bacterium]
MKNKKTMIIGGAIAAAVILLIVILCIVSAAKKKAKGKEAAPDLTENLPPTVNETVTREASLITGIEGSPAGIAVMADGSLLISDSRSKVMWTVSNGEAQVLAGKIGPDDAYGQPMGGYNDAPLSEAKFEKPWGVARFLDGWAVADSKNRVIRYFDGKLVRTAAYEGAERTLINPAGLASDDAGNLYIADAGANAIYKMDQYGILSLVADGFESPSGLCWDDGALYVADTGNHRICKVEQGLVSILAGGKEGFRDGSVMEACFQNPQGVAVGADGNVYVADTGNSSVRVIVGGEVKTLITCGSESTWPVSPIALTPFEGGLAVVDAFSGVVFRMPYPTN